MPKNLLLHMQDSRKNLFMSKVIKFNVNDHELDDAARLLLGTVAVQLRPT